MCFFRKKTKKKSEVTITFTGDKFDLLRKVLESEMDKFENIPSHQLIESELYSTMKKYCVACLFGTIHRSIEMSFTHENGNEILSLVVALMIAADEEKDPIKQKTLKSMAQELQDTHKELI